MKTKIKTLIFNIIISLDTVTFLTLTIHSHKHTHTIAFIPTRLDITLKCHTEGKSIYGGRCVVRGPPHWGVAPCGGTDQTYSNRAHWSLVILILCRYLWNLSQSRCCIAHNYIDAFSLSCYARQAVLF